MFVCLYFSANDEPRLQVIGAGDATGVIDPITGLLTEGYAVLERDENGVATLEVHFLPGQTNYYYKDKKHRRFFS